MNALIEEHAISFLDSTRTVHKDGFPTKCLLQNGFYNWLCKLNAIIEELDIKIKASKK